MEGCWYLRKMQDLLSDGKIPYERRLGEPFEGPMIPFGGMVEYHEISSKDQSKQGSTILVRRSCQEITRICIGYMRIWKGDILVADIEELENMDTSEIHARRLNAKEVLTPSWCDHFTFPKADGTAKMSGRDDGVRESTLTRDQPVGREDPREELPRNSERPQGTEETKDDAEARAGLLVDPK